jgi:dipeptidyl aminopeptidase/acylaminoacyl peptidase
MNAARVTLLVLPLALASVSASQTARAGASAQAGVARALTPADTVAIRTIGDFAVAPDGASILFTMLRAAPQTNRLDTILMLLKTGQGAPTELRLPATSVSAIRWAPDSKRFAFFATDPGAGQVGLYVMDVTAPEATAYGLKRICTYDRGNSFISKAGNALSWSPDGTKLAFAGTTEPAPRLGPDPVVVTRLQYKTRTSLSDNRRSHIFVVAATERSTPKPLTVGEFDNHSIDWRGDGSEIVFLSNREVDPDANLNYDIYAVNVSTGALRQVTKTPGVEMDPVVSPDGKSIAYLATTRPLTTIDSVAEDAHVFVVPFAGGEPRELNRALDRRSASPAWAPDSASVFFTASDHGRSLIYRVPAAGGASKPLFEKNAQIAGLSVARDGTLVFGMTDAVIPRELFRLPPGAGQPAQLTRLNADLVAQWKLVKPETIAFKSFDGTEIQGWLYPALDARGKTPMILDIHGGPHGAFGYGFNPEFQLYASRGYAVLAVNPRGSSGYGQAFSDGCVNDWGGADYKDLMAGVDAVLKTHPSLDGDRLGVTGGSYGGFMTNWAITQTTRFKAAASIASVSNLISFYATSLYQDLVHAEFNGFPWDGANFETLWKWSPVAHVKSVTTPTLFLHGEQDNDVHITQAEEMYTALRRRGIEAAFVRYPREGHGFREPRHRVDAMTRAVEWMDRFLMTAPPKPTTARQN